MYAGRKMPVIPVSIDYILFIIEDSSLIFFIHLLLHYF